MGSAISRLLHTRMLCVCLEVIGKTGCGHVMLGVTVLYVNEVAFQIYCFASIPPNNPFSIGFCNAKLFAKPMGLYSVEPLRGFT